MTEKWIKIVARNCYPLHWSAQLHQKFEGITLGKLYWSLNPDLLIKYNTPLSHLFAYSCSALKTNFLEYTKDINPFLDDALTQAINTIERDLKAEPGDNLQEIEDLYKRFKFEMGMMVMAFWWSRLIEDVLQKNIDPQVWEHHRDVILHPYKKSLLAREHEAITEAQNAYHEQKLSSGGLEDVAQRLADQYGFIHSEYKAKEWTSKDYLREITSEQQSIADDNDAKLHTNFTSYQDWLIKVAQRCVYIFDEGKSAVVRTNWALRKTLANMGLDEQEVLNCTEDEFFHWLKTKELPSSYALKERDLYHAILISEDKYQELTTKNEVEKLIREQEITEFNLITDKVTQLKGQVAYRGHVTGKVRILYSQRDAEKLEDGEILVASMTTPELIAGMRKSAAFVTDEGGITCHAAIVARELKKPCVIGTKIATKVLRDGDMVEVDANQGIVRVVE